MASGYLLGIDVGTTNTKAVLLDPATGRVVAVESQPTVTLHPRPEWSECDPDQLWQGVAATVRRAVAGRADDVRAVAVASMAEAGLPIDCQGRYLYPIILWHDRRSEPQARYWSRWMDERRLFEITGHPVQAIYSLNKLLWLRDNRPEVARDLHQWLCVEDFVLWQLSGSYATDYSMASRTMAFDQARLRWSEEVLEPTGFTPGVFPPAYPAGTVVGAVTAAAAAETGLPIGTPVVTGGHDHLCGSFAAGVVKPGRLLDSIGTGEACLLLAEGYTADHRLLHHGYCHYAHILPGQYVAVFGLGAGGGMVDWLLRRLYPVGSEDAEADFDTALAEAAAVPPGSEGVFWSPHLRGVAMPWGDSPSRAAVIGLTDTHGRGHLVRALLEGLSYWLRDNLDTIGKIVPFPPHGEIVTIGGGSRIALWMQIRADITGQPIRVVEVPEATAVGAALLAGVGSGQFPSFQAAADSVARSTTLYEPDPSRAEAYSRYYEAIYRDLYPAIRSLHRRVHDLFGSNHGVPRS